MTPFAKAIWEGYSRLTPSETRTCETQNLGRSAEPYLLTHPILSGKRIKLMPFEMTDLQSNAY